MIFFIRRSIKSRAADVDFCVKVYNFTSLEILIKIEQKSSDNIENTSKIKAFRRKAHLTIGCVILTNV